MSCTKHFTFVRYVCFKKHLQFLKSFLKLLPRHTLNTSYKALCLSFFFFLKILVLPISIHESETKRANTCLLWNTWSQPRASFWTASLGSKHILGKTLYVLFCTRELTNTYSYLVSLYLTGKREYAIPPTQRAWPDLLFWLLTMAVVLSRFEGQLGERFSVEKFYTL